jgi:phage terminase large subunit-like protein
MSLIESLRGRVTKKEVKEALRRRQSDQAQRNLDRSIPAVRARCERSLYAFVKEAWHVLEPATPFVPNWHLEAVCQHLTAVTDGQITRLLINIPPGSMKSLLVSSFWPAWEWGPRSMMSLRYLTTSFAEIAVGRDCRRMRDLILSDWYQKHWPDVVLRRVGEFSFENSMTGSRDGIPFGSLTSKRGDRLIIDDPHSVIRAESKLERLTTVRKFREGAINRLNDQKRSAIVVVMQRLHSGDIAGEIMDTGMGYTCLVLPMEYEGGRHCSTELGFSDPRSAEGELLCPARWSKDVCDDLKRDMGPVGWASQYQQRPVPRGGGILPYNGWEYWSKAVSLIYGRSENQFPDFDYILGVVDTAFREGQEHDYSAFVCLGTWVNLYGQPQVMLVHAWRKRLKFHDLVQEVIASAEKKRCDRLLVENKASGISVFQEIVRLTRDESFAVQLIDPKGEDKEARANSVSHFLGEERDDGTRRTGLVWVPALTQPDGQIWPREWAELLMAEASEFPKGKHDDLVDCFVHGLRFLRLRGLVRRPREVEIEVETALRDPGTGPAPLYPT